MKIRNGFVSNSSSASFILIANTNPQDSKKFGQTFTRTSLNHSTVHNDYEILQVEPFTEETSYCRRDIKYLNSITDKVKYVLALYALYYESDPDYFKKVLDAKNKIFNLGRKHWYSLGIPIPPLFARYESDWDSENRCFLDTKSIETYVNVFTECEYSDKIVKMVEDDDTTLLDSFLFNSDSFAVLGGDEYDETYELQRKAVEFLNERRKENPDFSYTLFCDWTEHNADDISYVDTDGVEHKYGYDFHWEEDCFIHNYY